MSRRALGYCFTFAALASGVGWLFFENFAVDGWKNLQIVRRAKPLSQEVSSTTAANPVIQSSFDASSPLPANHPIPTTVQGRRTISVATFNMESFNQTKARKLAVIDIYLRILRQFDVIALQEIQSDTDDLLPRLTSQLNSHGDTFDYVIGPRVGPKGMTEQLGFIFKLDTVEIDRNALYSIDDRDNLLTREPLVAWFRARGVAADQAFTFSLVNVHVDPNRARDEIPVLRDIMFKVREDGRNEDDVIMLGDFAPGYRKRPELVDIADIGWAIGTAPTLTDGSRSVDNIAFQKTSTVEFTGRAGVFDFLREYNLSMEQAQEVSDHMPVFAVFSFFEGGELGRVALNPSNFAK